MSPSPSNRAKPLDVREGKLAKARHSFDQLKEVWPELFQEGAFLTGSRAYGDPGPKSDIDLVVHVTSDTLLVLKNASGMEFDREKPHDYQGTVAASLRFGILNLICVVDEDAFCCWRSTTATLVRKMAKDNKPVPRDYAVKAFKRAFKNLDDERIGHKPRAFFESP